MLEPLKDIIKLLAEIAVDQHFKEELAKQTLAKNLPLQKAKALE